MSTLILDGHPGAEKCAYITVIASIATADQSASDTEINYIIGLADQAGLNDEEKETVIYAAKDATGSTLKPSLDTLKGSELRFSLMADLIAFAESDSNLSEQEKAHIAGIADYLGIDESQLAALNQFAKEATSQPVAMGVAGGGVGNGFLDNLGGLGGIGEKLQGAGINMGSLTKGLIGMIGPMIMGNMLNKGLNNNTATAGGGLQGGLGSLVSGLTGGKGLSGLGGLLSGFMK